WPSEPSFHYLAVLPILLAVWRVPSLHTEAGNYNAYINSGIIFGMCLIFVRATRVPPILLTDVF
ncbi:MAG: hypothetical protein VX657_00225, partial [Pseudomonadota bacterium]|nr:hypothetical protein [Pseudomonadota bacterium]